MRRAARVEVKSADEFDEAFELARPGQGFDPGIINHMKRRR